MGDLFICNTTQCLHRASSPELGKTRDMLFLTFAVSNIEKETHSDLFFFEKQHFNDLWGNGYNLGKKLCKPKSIKKQLKIFKDFFRNKFIN